MNKNISTIIPLHNLNNTRDLGGIQTEDGRRIKPGKLVRSGQLYFADEEDIRRLRAFRFQRIYDFRSYQEREEKPDPELGKTLNIHLPIISDVAAGVTHDEESDNMAFDMIITKAAHDAEFAMEYMKNTYIGFVTDEHAIREYTRFLKEIASMDDGAILWHCTAGKDRAGFATVLLLTILGVKKEDIIEDYLATNEYLEGEIWGIIQMLKEKLPIGDGEDIIWDFFGAKTEYIMTDYDIVEKQYGSMRTFVTEVLGITEEEIQKIQDKFLIPNA